MGVRLVVIWRPSRWACRAADRFERLLGDAVPRQRAHEEGSGCKLVFETGVVVGASLGDDPRAVGVDDSGQGLRPVSGLAGLHEELHPANVLNLVVSLYPIPEHFPSRTEFPGWMRDVFGPFPDNGKRWWFRRFFFHDFLASNVFLNYSRISPPPRSGVGHPSRKSRAPRDVGKNGSRRRVGFWLLLITPRMRGPK